jgi:tape measure domain-containing protein
MADVNKTVAIIFEATDNASVTAKALAKSVADVGDASVLSSRQIAESIAAEEKWANSSIKAAQEQKALADATKNQADVTEKAGGSLDKYATALKAIATAAVVKSFIDANIEAEKFEKTMTLLTGSSEKANEEFKFVSNAASGLGFKIFELTGACANLTPATKGTSLEGQATRDVFVAIAGGMDALGKSSTQTQNALDAVAKIASNSDASLKTLKTTLDTALPGAFKATADELGLTTDAFEKLLKTGGIGSEQVIPALTNALNGLFGGSTFNSYADQVTKLQNSLTLAFIEIGKAGTMDALTNAVNLGTAAVVGAVSGFRLLGEVIGIVVGALTNGDIFNNTSSFGDAIDAAMSKAAESTRGARDSLLGFKDEATSSAVAVSKVSEETNLFAGDVRKYEEAQKLAAAATTKASDSSKIAAAELKKQADETKRAEENAAKFALELEKLASNERIKTLEFKAEIDVARIQADAEKVKAAFDSINVGIESTGNLLGDLFGMFGQLNGLDSSAYNAVFQQIDKENVLREKSFQLQEKLTQAQIDNLNAQTKALASGDAIIKIDGAGLQPHLEAFMWEILKAIQVKANKDGMAFLLGV